MKSYHKLLPRLGLIVGLVLTAGCTKEAKIGRLAKQAEADLAAGKFDAAEIAYKNILLTDPRHASAIGKLGILYAEQGRHLRGLSYLTKAAELQPQNLEVKFKLGTLSASMGRVKEAREAAAAVLAANPAHPDAPVLLSETSASANEFRDSRQRLQNLGPKLAETAPVLTALAILDLRERKIDGADASLQRALRADPKSAAAHSIAGMLHLVRQDPVKAEAAYKAAAEYSPLRSGKRIQYAKFVAQKDVPGAKRLLEEITKAAPDYLPAWMTLAEFAQLERKFDDSLGYLNKVLARESAHVDALLLKANVFIAKGEPDKGVAELERMAGNFPQSALIHYQLGQAYLSAGNPTKAAASYQQAVTLAPTYAEAILAQAALSIRRDDISPAVVASLKRVTQQRPDLLQGYLLLADALRGQAKLDDALVVYAEIDKKFPRVPQSHLLAGLILLRQNKLPEARKSFERALELGPNLTGAVEQLVTLDFMEKKGDAARARVEVFIARNPKMAEAYILLSRVMLTLKDEQLAEMALQKAISVQPDYPTSYQLLARLQMTRNEPAKAISNLQSVLQKNPKQADALMLLATIYQQQNKQTEAREAYEKLLEVNPRFAAAYNNLAYIYAEHTNELDRAFEMAQKARQLLPHDGNVADTLGWILYKKQQFAPAVALLEESADKLQTSADVYYHLGLARYMLGEEPAAKAALSKALELNPTFDGHEDAKRRIALLTGQGVDRPALEKMLADKKDDPIALSRLGVVYERERAYDKALATYEKALTISPNSIPLLVGQTRVLNALKQPARALEVAKNARKVSPDDPAVAHILGRLANESGSHSWGYSLLQEAARKTPDNAEVLFDAAQGAAAVGKLADAESAARKGLEISPTSPSAAAARQLVDTIALATQPTTPGAEARIIAALKTSPNDPAANLALGGLQESKRDFAAATKTYEKLLSSYSDFNPARKRLAILYSRSSESDGKKALEMATKAREAYPDDPEVAKAFGVILYRQNNYSRAMPLLRESAAKQEKDAETFYYLGLVRHKLKELTQAKKDLQRALDLNLSNDLATEARRLLAELK